MSSSDSSASESDISEEEYSDGDSSSSSSDDSSSDDSSSDDSDDEGRKKSSRWRRRHRQLRTRAQNTQEEADQTQKIEESQAIMDNTMAVLIGTIGRSGASAAAGALESAEAEAQAAADALAREEAEAEAKAEEMRRQQALLAAMMSALAMIKMEQKRIQGNITNLNKNKPETENLVMAPTLLWSGETNGLANFLSVDVMLDTLIKIKMGCLKFKDIVEIKDILTSVPERSARFDNDVQSMGRLYRQVNHQIEVERAMDLAEKAQQTADHVTAEMARRQTGTLGSNVIKLSIKIKAKGIKDGLLDKCDIPMMIIRALFGKYKEDCNQKEDIMLFFKYPEIQAFETIAEADNFYGKTGMTDHKKNKPLIAGGEFTPATEEMESTLEKRRVKRRTDNETLETTFTGVFSDFVKSGKSTLSVGSNLWEDIAKSVTGASTYKNIAYWLRGVFGQNAQNLVAALPSAIKLWGSSLNETLSSNIPYCPTGALTERLGIWVRNLNININYGPNYTYDHFGCIFSLDLEGDRELEPYYIRDGVKQYIKDHIDTNYGNTTKAPPTPHDDHAGHVLFQLRRMYERAIDSGFKPSLKMDSKVIQGDELLRQHCECFASWKKDMEIQNKALQNWNEMRTTQDMSIDIQLQKIQNLQNDKGPTPRVEFPLI